MSEIIEILGEKKFVGSKTKELKSRIVFEETKKMRYDNNLFFDVSQQTQFINEKNDSNNFRIYGKINPIINLSVHQEVVGNKDIIIEVDDSLFDMNLINWSIVVLKSKRLESSVDLNGNQKYVKGVKKLNKKTDSNDVIVDLDFKNGLPARQSIEETSDINIDNFCLGLPLGHNFSVGDKIKVNSLKPDLLDSKIYNVVDVINNMVYIDAKPLKTVRVKKSTSNTNVSVKNVNDFVSNAENNIEFNKDKSTQIFGNFSFNQEEILKIITPRPDVQTLIKPDFYVSKVVEKELLEYYVKTLEVVAIVDQLDICAFSVNNFNQPIYNFFVNGDLNLEELYDNLNYPINDLYIGIIKNGAPTPNVYSNVESNFSNNINNMAPEYGIETITNNKIGINSKVKIGDQFFHSICEHTTENLTETEISYIHHRFIHKNISFSYNPFKKIQLKLKSPYIEDGETVENMPNYAIYSREREKYIWRDIFDVGIVDENGLSIDFPFMNGSFYVFNDINFFLTPEPSAVRKYTLNINDVTSANGSEFINQFDDAFRDFGLDDDPNGIKPFNEYQDIKC
jgi:hypothetical protein